MKKILRKIPSGVLSVIVTLLVAYVLLSPPPVISSGWLHWLHFKNSDKVVHACLFFLLNFAYLYDYTKLKSPHHTKVNKELAFTFLASAMGLLSETAQLAMGLGRTFEVADIVADVVGAFLAFVAMHFWGGHLLRKHVFYTRRRRHRSHHSHGHSTHKTGDSAAER